MAPAPTKKSVSDNEMIYTLWAFRRNNRLLQYTINANKLPITDKIAIIDSATRYGTLISNSQIRLALIISAVGGIDVIELESLNLVEFLLCRKM